MPLRFGALCLAAAGCGLLGPVAGVLPQTLASEGEAVALLREKDAAAQCDLDGAGWLIKRGWWNAARALVTASHTQADGKCRASIETVVRRHVGDMKIQADALLLALAPAAADKVGVVRCSFQWAQNSSAVFLSVKFSHRWSSPGALKIYDEKASVTDCCFNFSASGEHSQLRKRYTLDIAFHKEVDPAAYSWQHASAGRLTVEIKKKVPAHWPRLTAGKEKPGNMALWESMHSRWDSELEAFDRAAAAERRKAQGKSSDDKKKGSKADNDDDDDDEQLHEAGKTACFDNRQSPFYRTGTQLCKEYWPPAMKGKRGQETTWLVLFYSPSSLKCRERDKECIDVTDKWRALMTKVPQVSKAKLAIVDCDEQKALCSEQRVGHLPYVRRYKNSSKKAYYGEWDIDSVMSFLIPKKK